MTIDLEDWFHAFLFDTNCRNNFKRRAHIETHKFLELLEGYESHATFFVLGEVAESNRDLIREISNNGHEIGSHGYHHECIYNLAPESFREDLRKSVDLLESITGKPVLSYRAPFFSVLERTLWALEILREEGIKHDSSIFPIKNYRYGMPNAQRVPNEIIPGLWEWPITTLPSKIGNIPFAGGIYFRFFPWKFISYAIGKIEERNEPILIYLHPWELDPDQPQYVSNSWFLNVRHYYGLRKTEEKVRCLLSLGKFDTLSSGVEHIMNEANKTDELAVSCGEA